MTMGSPYSTLETGPAIGPRSEARHTYSTGPDIICPILATKSTSSSSSIDIMSIPVRIREQFYELFDDRIPRKMVPLQSWLYIQQLANHAIAGYARLTYSGTGIAIPDDHPFPVGSFVRKLSDFQPGRHIPRDANLQDDTAGKGERPHSPLTDVTCPILVPYVWTQQGGEIPRIMTIPSSIRAQFVAFLSNDWPSNTVSLQSWQYVMQLCKHAVSRYAQAICIISRSPYRQSIPSGDVLENTSMSVPLATNTSAPSSSAVVGAVVDPSLPLIATSAESAEMPRMHVDGVTCLWAGCHRRIATAKVPAIEAHLRECHILDWRHVSDRRRSHACEWHGCIPHKLYLYGGLAKHIATRHLRLTTKLCPVCRIPLSRSDSVARHILKKHKTNSYYPDDHNPIEASRS